MVLRRSSPRGAAKVDVLDSGFGKAQPGWGEPVPDALVGPHGDLAVEHQAEPTSTATTGRTSGRRVAKSIFIKGQGCRSGRCAGKAIELTWGGLRHVPTSELREPQGDLTVMQESAEGVVGNAVGKASKALQGRKAEQMDRPSWKR
ncbi:MULTISPECIES: hypothetical protein [unclassified Mesorhizobium]|uniref:hypothetical protein n=1 Tax=unclassified Mesorhizobium TaxID=325217 RepID=UPI0024794AFE|nr:MULTISPECIES: hypothetical protein [unclassified Mesorhizobium]